MMMTLHRSRAGVVSIEFAMLSGLLVLLLLGTLGLALVLLSETALQSVAAATARCVALDSPLCPTPANYAVNLASQRLFAGVISSSDVTISSAANCNGSAGVFATATITASYWNGLLTTIFASPQITVQACYPVSG